MRLCFVVDYACQSPNSVIPRKITWKIDVMLVACQRFPLHMWNVVLILFMQPKSSVEKGTVTAPSWAAKKGVV